MREIIGSIISEVVIRHRRSSGIAPEMLKVDMKLYTSRHKSLWQEIIAPMDSGTAVLKF